MLRISCSFCRNTNAQYEDGEWRFIPTLNICCKNDIDEIQLHIESQKHHGNEDHNNIGSDEPSFYDWEKSR